MFRSLDALRFSLFNNSESTEYEWKWVPTGEIGGWITPRDGQDVKKGESNTTILLTSVTSAFVDPATYAFVAFPEITTALEFTGSAPSTSCLLTDS
ncbi:hypothetical protein EST38_g14431 [Candolleomyces aberdarensis]|uniref:Uncharacterized protein n=1 Tax=Candolleomyces aberdarensis TaxID=2316362 RepID=A0A4Q2CZP3_9AGAR|nr:hypothetical protein EST38_g14431 [Candolleomyces aberdarensis]